MNLAELIREHRKAAHLTQAELAEKAGVGKSLIFELEKGSEKISLENILKVIKILNIKLEFRAPS